MLKLLELLKSNAKLTNEQLASMLGMSVEEVEKTIAKLEKNKTIVCYSAVINWDKTEKDSTTALIEIKVSPQRGHGFEAVAERIYQFPEVKSLYLVSGAFDFLAVVEGKTLKDVATFVSSRLAPLDQILSCSTHFLLKKYKDDGVVFVENEPPVREEGLF
ncbi:MAG: Lrp/AsnC family transcriptional regulator [Lachnospiraceae bacterium]|nr:Lrp/AsnC family transcriptional regulator [Lachnospiraceae bacterium]MBR5769922.1 Lrp/AsnC family transcriptional regulator [Clostridia bacterium]